MNDHDMQTWMLNYLAAELRCDASQLAINESFDAIGVDSLLAVTLLEEVRKNFGLRLKPTAFYENNSVQALAAHVLGQLALTQE
jgi:acyl carrier protein